MQSANDLQKTGRVWSVTAFPKSEEVWPTNGYPEFLNVAIERLMQIPTTEIAYSENYDPHPWCVAELQPRTPQGGVMCIQSERCPTTGQLHYQIGIRMQKPTRGNYIKRYVCNVKNKIDYF